MACNDTAHQQVPEDKAVQGGEAWLLLTADYDRTPKAGER